MKSGFKERLSFVADRVLATVFLPTYTIRSVAGNVRAEALFPEVVERNGRPFQAHEIIIKGVLVDLVKLGCLIGTLLFTVRGETDKALVCTATVMSLGLMQFADYESKVRMYPPKR